MSCSAVGHELHVNESTMYLNTMSFNRNTPNTRFSTDQLTEML